MKRILIFISSYEIGGVEIALNSLLEKIDKNKFDLTVLNMYESQKKIITTKNVKIICVYNSKIEEKIKKLEKLNLFKPIVKILKIFLWNIAVLKTKKISEEYNTIIDYRLALTRKSYNFKYLNLIGFQHMPINPKKNNVSKIKMVNRLKNYKKIVCVSEGCKNEILEINPNLKNVVSIYNIIDLKKILKMSDNYSELNEIEKKLIKENYVISVSRLSREKRVDSLIKAYKKSEILEKLIIIGEGPERKKIENLIKEKSLSKQVFLLGFKKNTYVWIKNSKGLVLNSEKEGLSLVLIESLVLNKPTVSTDCPVGPREVLDNGKIGKLIDINNELELVETLKDLSLNKIQFTKEEYDFYLKKFDGELNIKKIHDLLEEY